MHKIQPEHPLLPKRFHQWQHIWLDLDQDDTPALHSQLKHDHTEQQTQTLFLGKYAENRTIYTQARFLKQEPRTFHLGIDIQLLPETEIHLPLSGKVHSTGNNKGRGNYGPTVIIEHNQNGQNFYSLYGHLTLQTLSLLAVGQPLSSGDIFAHIGNQEENGGWPPHIHVQLIYDIAEHKGDYPGVCSPSEKMSYLKNCPNPLHFIGLD